MSLFILVVGGGKLGANLTRLLMAGGFEVALIEQRHAKFNALQQEFEHAAVLGDGTEISVLEKAGIARADYVLAVTGDDEDNIIISQLATDKYEIENVIARVNDPRNEHTFALLGVRSTVNPVGYFISLVEHRLPRHRLLSLLNFEEENVKVVESILSENSNVVGKRLADLRFPPGILLAMIFREHQAIVPHGEIELQAEDHLIIIVEGGLEDELDAIMGGEVDGE